MLETALIALARREMDESPTANFGRIIDGNRQSSYSKDGIGGGQVPDGETEPNCADGRGPVPWTNVEHVAGPAWMELEWSEPYLLEDRLEPALPDNGASRIWDGAEVPPLACIGETPDFTGRLRRHEATFSSDALFSVATLDGLEEKHEQTEIETDLIGVHYLATNQSPWLQF